MWDFYFMYKISNKQLNELPSDLFIVVKACVEPAMLFGWVDSRRMMCWFATDSLNNTPPVLNSVFPSPRLVALARLALYTLLPRRGEIDGFIPLPKALMLSQIQTSSSRIWILQKMKWKIIKIYHANPIAWKNKYNSSTHPTHYKTMKLGNINIFFSQSKIRKKKDTAVLFV